MRGHGLLNRQVILAALIAGIALEGVAVAQHEHTTPTGAVQRFACENDGLIRGTPFGCQLLVRSTVAEFPAGTRRALFIVIHDPSVPEASTSQWAPSGACSR
jgi:hypothetical protein